jgi:glucose-1-phosphate adenylyltransferase
MVDTYMMGGDNYETLDEIREDSASGIPPIGVGERCYIRNAILDKNVRIGNDVRINGGAHLENKDHPLFTVKDGIVVVKKGAIIPDGFVI